MPSPNNQEAQVLSDEELDAIARRVINTAKGKFMPGDMGAARKMLATARNDRARLLDYIAAQAKTIAGLQEWRPIESCPSDGSPVWTYWPAWNDAREDIQHDERVLRREADGHFWRSGLEHGPTHWMPDIAPTPPSDYDSHNVLAGENVAA